MDDAEMNGLADNRDSNGIAEDISDEDARFTYEKFYDAYDHLDSDLRDEISCELERRHDYEMSMHATCVNKLGILTAFSSLITIESALNIANTAVDIFKIHSVLYLTGLVAVLISTFVSLYGIVCWYASPPSGMHFWDIEDSVISGNTEVLSEQIGKGFFRSLEHYALFNMTLEKIIFVVSAFLVAGITLIIIGIFAGVEWHGLI